MFDDASSTLYAVKNPQFAYTQVSAPLSQLLGFKRGQDVLGLTDIDLNCAAAKNATWFQRHDQHIVDQHAKLTLIGFNQYADGWHLLLTQKQAIINPQTQEPNIAIQTLDITDLSLLNSGILLSDVLSQKILQRQAFSLHISGSYSDIALSRQESLCLFYFFHGYTSKIIAKHLGISPATVETYLNRIKHKLGCSKRSQIIEKMHHLNLGQMLIR